MPESTKGPDQAQVNTVLVRSSSDDYLDYLLKQATLLLSLTRSSRRQPNHSQAVQSIE